MTTVTSVFHRSLMREPPEFYLLTTSPKDCCLQIPKDLQATDITNFFVTGVNQPAGRAFQAASMLFNMSSVLPPAIQAVASFQKEPEPMAAGIMSAPSKRKTSEFFNVSAKLRIAGSLKLAVSKSLRVDRLTSPPLTMAVW